MSRGTMKKSMHSWDLVIFSDMELSSFLILEEVLSLIFVENTRENYFYVAKHPVPFEGGRRENLTMLSPFLTLCSLQT